MPFYKLQRIAVDIIKCKFPKNKYLEDYLTLFPDISDKFFNQERFYEQIQPLVTIASNNGFEFL